MRVSTVDSTWRRTTVRISVSFDGKTEAAREDALAWMCSAAPGLAVTKRDTDEARARRRGRYAITHVESGRMLYPDGRADLGRFAKLAEAQGMVLRLAPLADWSLPSESLAMDEPTRERARALFYARAGEC